MTLGGDRVADQCTKMDCPKNISQCTYILSGPVHAVTPPNKRRCGPCGCGREDNSRILSAHCKHKLSRMRRAGFVAQRMPVLEEAF